VLESPIQILPLHDAPLLEAATPVTIGVDGDGEMPPDLAARFDILLTARQNPAREWVHARNLEATLKRLADTIRQAPVAATMLAQLLRMNERLSFDQALIAESLAYSALLGGDEFRRWRAANPARGFEGPDKPRIKLERRDDVLFIVLAHAERRNAIDAHMRDELVEALQLPLLDESIRKVMLRGEGACFSSGGDLAEFGTAKDLALAHRIRIMQSPVRDIHRLKGRTTAFLHGACAGSGLEIGAAAGRVIGSEDVSFRLPEVAMGLVPGAGGTVSVSRRIGRHRTCFLALFTQAIGASEALAWGLIDEVGNSR